MRRTKITAAFALSVVMGLSLMAGCANTSDVSQQESTQIVYGMVEEADEDSVTIQEGTLKEDTESSTGEDKESESGGEDLLDLTGTQSTITITDDTEVSFGGGDRQGKPPEKPAGGSETDGENQPPEKPGQDAQEGALSLKEGDVISVTLDQDGNADEITILSGGMQDGPGQGQPGAGQSQEPESYDASETIDSDTETTGKNYESDGTDENAVLVTEGATAVIDDAVISRNSSESSGGDNASFYGVGSALLSLGTTKISNSVITTDANGGAGVFAYGDGVVYVSDTQITTQKGTSGGIHAAGGGTVYATNVTAETQGESSAAIRSDRGGGTIVVDGGSYTANGTGSPAVYCTADISVTGAKLTATGSEAVCIEGMNSLKLKDTDLSGNMPDSDQNDCTWNVILYQSMSGDSEEGNSVFQMDGGTLTAKNGGMFYTTNTESTFVLHDVDITYADDSDFFLKCTGNSNQRGWGSAGANGADSVFTAIDQEMEGDVIWDSISCLDFYMTEGSSLTGAVTDDESNAGSGGEGYCNMYISSDSTWTVTGDSTLTGLYSEGTIVDKTGKTVTIKGSDGTVYVKGDSTFTITTSSYDTNADMSGSGTLQDM